MPLVSAGASLGNSGFGREDCHLRQDHVSTINKPAGLDDVDLRETLKRCSPATYYAACKFRQTHEPRHLVDVVHGVIERHVDRELRPKLRATPALLRLREDLGLDSLTLMEVVMLAEEVLHISVSNEDLAAIQTVGDVEDVITRKIADLARLEPGG